jgi:hypothetical protein
MMRTKLKGQVDGKARSESTTSDKVTWLVLLLYVQVLVVNSLLLLSSHSSSSLLFSLVIAWRRSSHWKNRSEKVSPCYVCKRFLPTVCIISLVRQDDSVWVHDRAPGAPRAATQSSNPNASLSNKLMVTNLHYEITPKDLTVCPDPLLPHSHIMTFYYLEAIFGQIGTLVREPFIRVRKSDYHYLALLS